MRWIRAGVRVKKDGHGEVDCKAGARKQPTRSSQVAMGAQGLSSWAVRSEDGCPRKLSASSAAWRGRRPEASPRILGGPSL